jgi:hypothetical protein
MEFGWYITLAGVHIEHGNAIYQVSSGEEDEEGLNEPCSRSVIPSHRMQCPPFPGRHGYPPPD